MRASPNRGSCRRTRRREVDTVLLADGINADQMLLVMLQPARRGGVSRYHVAAQDIQPQCVHLWSALCPSDTHARFVDESQSFRRAVRGFYDTAVKLLSGLSTGVKHGTTLSGGRPLSCGALHRGVVRHV